MGPVTIRQQVAREVVGVRALLDHHNRAAPLVVQREKNDSSKKRKRTVTFGLGVRLLRIDQVVRDQNVAAAAGDAGADRSRSCGRDWRW